MTSKIKEVIEYMQCAVALSDNSGCRNVSVDYIRDWLDSLKQHEQQTPATVPEGPATEGSRDVHSAAHVLAELRARAMKKKAAAQANAKYEKCHDGWEAEMAYDAEASMCDEMISWLDELSSCQQKEAANTRTC